MKLLDLFCGAGGSAVGYHRAGFDEIVGVDIKPQPGYPFEFVQADALEYPLDGFDLIHASPPCQKWTCARNHPLRSDKQYADYLTPIRKNLKQLKTAWVIENVPNAPINTTITLCGIMFGLKVFRHRLFEMSHLIFQPEHPSHKGKFIGFGYSSVAGNGGGCKGKNGKRVKNSTKDWPVAMGIDWMTRKELTQAIPPAYSEFIGRQIISVLHRRNDSLHERKSDTAASPGRKKDCSQNMDARLGNESSGNSCPEA